MEKVQRFSTVYNQRVDRTLGSFIFCKWAWKRKVLGVIYNYNSISVILFLIISTIIPTTMTHPLVSSQSDCDWNGRGALPSPSFSSGSRSIQTMTFRCTRGRVHWDDPSGGLRVEISPTLEPPYKLCLEDRRGVKTDETMMERSSSPRQFQTPRRDHRILLEQASGRLLQVLSSEMKNSDCYEISGPSAILYVETGGSGGGGAGGGVNSQVKGNQVMSTEDTSASDGSITLSYEVEPLRGNGDECSPCSESEVLKAYCSSDVVARGSILQIIPGFQYDWIYIKSDLVIHQNQPVFTHFQPPMINFLTTLPQRFDMDKPQRATGESSGGHQAFQGIISHPSKCSASVGDGDFLWLIKFRFGMPLTNCVIYWDKWVELAERSQGECPLSTKRE